MNSPTDEAEKKERARRVEEATNIYSAAWKTMIHFEPMRIEGFSPLRPLNCPDSDYDYWVRCHSEAVRNHFAILDIYDDSMQKIERICAAVKMLSEKHPGSKFEPLEVPWEIDPAEELDNPWEGDEL